MVGPLLSHSLVLGRDLNIPACKKYTQAKLYELD
jgi:hypothetical protein